MMKKIRILIVDDHEIIHRGVMDLLQNEKEYTVDGHAYNGKEAIEKARELLPNIIFMDISMPVMNGIETIKTLAPELPDTKFIVLSQHDENEFVLQALTAGAHGYLLKNSTKDVFIEAIRQVMANNRYLDAYTSQKMIEVSMKNLHADQSVSAIYITRREKEIIRKIAEDKSNQQIADEMNISLRTVETHRRNVMQKLKVNTVVGLLKIAIKLNLISLK